MPPEAEVQSTEAKRAYEAHPLVKYLTKLVDSEDRAALAQLRRAAARYPETDEYVYRHVGPFLRDDLRGSQEDAMIIVATLFGLHPCRDKDVDLGETMRQVMSHRKSKTATTSNVDPAVERRFLALLGADPMDIHMHLRHAITLAKSADAQMGWSKLVWDLTRLLESDEESRSRVIRKWSRSFWGHQHKTDTDENGSIKDPNT